MKYALLSAPLALLASLAVLGCQTPDKGATAGTNIKTAGDQTGLAAQQIDTTVASLHDLVDRPAPDLTKQRSTYESNLSTLESTVAGLQQTTAKMRTEGDQYFAEWDQQIKSIQNEDIREESMDRRKAIEASLSKAQKEYGDIKTDLEELLQNFRDVRTALKADLTMAGIESLKPTVKEIDKDAKSVTTDLRDASKRFTDLSTELARSGPPAPAK